MQYLLEALVNCLDVSLQPAITDSFGHRGAVETSYKMNVDISPPKEVLHT